MTEVTTLLAEAAEGAAKLPLEHGNAPLLPMPYDMVWSAVCTVVVILLFWKLVLPKYNEVLDQREESIKGSIARAEAAQEEAKAALEKYNGQLAEARAEAAQIREDARVKGKQIVEDAKIQATEEQNRIIAVGEKQLRAERERVVADLRKEMGANSIELAERLLGDQLDDNVKRGGTIDRFLNDLDNVAPAGK
ncbi:F0F1 ATP synthase subunit B [Corynebacterium mendelii]|uniref:ATP synthase subunit b n=1 Tax=Corynebacterium mendelii TaxID=2765362 RepID=A0A939IYB4_9CORY|nr:F0F1 ATP synthase subunit B [Corynebacterium mendelii]MBN9644948.1 F0F1 ATP synthase subunit B [Corynebacterium mendelii]